MALVGMWTKCRTRLTLKRRLAEDHVMWANFLSWDVKPWLDMYLPVAVDAFFEYEDDLPRTVYEQEVTKRLSELLRASKTNRDHEQRLYEAHQWY
jgi:hypothetical protein